MPYTAARPSNALSSEQLRVRIPGWGVDLDPADRPSVPREQLDRDRSHVPWDFPDRQPETRPRERSIEHQFLTPVFGTACPPRGFSGVLRKLAYRRYSEGRAAHWLILLAADRVDVLESRVTSLAAGRPDNLLTETGIRSERSARGLTSRIGRNRADVRHQWLDPIVIAAPWVVGGTVAYRVLRRRNG